MNFVPLWVNCGYAPYFPLHFSLEYAILTSVEKPGKIRS